jgi:hypothetical protein
MANGWTPERKARQSLLIRSWRPWETTQGPVSPEGKKRSAMRGYKGDPRGTLAEARRLARLIAGDAKSREV